MYHALVSGLGWHVEDLDRAARRLDMPLTSIPFERITARVGGAIAGDGHPLDQSDGVLVRMMPPGTLEQVVFRMDALQRLEAAGIPVLNPPRAVEAAVDKYLSLARLAAEGIPVPETWAGESADAAMNAFESFGGDAIIKPLFGSEGRGLMRVSHTELARRAFSTLEHLGAVLYLQEFLPNPGHDVRAFVLGNRVIAGMRRHVPPGDWRANVAVGGRAEPCAIDPAIERLALRAAAAIGARMAGVDLLPTNDGRWVVLEINAVPGWRALAATTDIDIAAEILDELRSRRS